MPAGHRLVARVCEKCEREFMARASDVTRGKGRFCSRPCLSSANARISHARHSQAGESNGNFKGWASRRPRVYVDRFRAKYPEKARAHDAVKNALKAGLLVRPAACPQCGLAVPVAAHHDDYAKPLDVRFACRPCHRLLDLARRAQAHGVQQAADSVGVHPENPNGSVRFS